MNKATEGYIYYFQNGKPKKQYMACQHPEIYGGDKGTCHGNCCPMYGIACGQDILRQMAQEKKNN